MLVAGSMGVTGVIAYYGQGVFSPFCVWFLLIILIGGLILGRRVAFFSGVLGIFSLVVLAFAVRQFSPAALGLEDVLMQTLNLVLGVAVCSFIAIYLAGQLGQTRRVLTKQQADLADSKALFQASMSISADAIVLINGAGVIEMFSQGAEQLFGISAEQAVGSAMSEVLIPPRLIPDHASGFQRYLDTGVANILGIRLETYSQFKDGSEFPVELMIEKVMLAEQTHFVAQIKDLSERNQLRSALEIKEEQVGLDHRLEVMGRLSGAVAHDFNNLLMAINGYTELLLARQELSEQVRDDIREISRAGEQASQLTKQLLNYSRKDRLAPEHISPAAMIEDLVGMFGRILPAAVDLQTDFNNSSWLVQTGGARLEQAILNLLLNAADALPEGGTVWVRVQDVAVDAEKARTLNDLRVGDYACIEVEDKGIGMDKEVMEHIFDPYYTTKKVGKGTGLGLATSKTIVKQSGGTIAVQSEKNKGTTFFIYLPRAGEVEKYYSIPDKAIQQNSAMSGTILVVEDDPAVQKILTRALISDGFEVLGAENGEQGYEIALRHSKQINLVITDVVMPKLGGPEMVRRLMVSFPDMKVIYVSGYSDNKLESSDIDNPRAEFLAKPYSYKDLKGLTSKLLLMN
ncbi:MAG: PAS domain S-box protein [Gammaproteobacteria bacterium]|nr:PAS domain S-box protein [Gammaproteobacteria bacterium]